MDYIQRRMRDFTGKGRKGSGMDTPYHEAA